MGKHPIAGLMFPLVLMLLTTASCKKDDVLHVDGAASAIRPPRPMVQTITTTDYQGYTGWSHYYYDSIWRVQRVEGYNSINHNNFTDAYIYDSLNRGYYENNSWYRFTNGLVAEHSSYSEYYSYNSNNNVLSKSMLHGYINYYYSATYNLDSSHVNGEYNSSDRINYDDSYFYNTHINTIGNYDKGEYMWGKSSVNLPGYAINKMYLSSQGPPTDFFNFTLYSYQYNDSGWVSHQEMKRSSIAQIYTDSVNYTLDTTYYIYNYDYTYY